MEESKRIILVEGPYECPVDATTGTHCTDGLVNLADSEFNGAPGMPAITIHSNEVDIMGTRTVDATVEIDPAICPAHVFINGAVSDFQSDGSNVTFTEV